MSFALNASHKTTRGGAFPLTGRTDTRNRCMGIPTTGDARRSDRWIRGGFALTLVIFGAIAVTAYLGMNSYLANTRTVAVSDRFHMRLDDLVSSIKDVQRGTRGYVISGDTAFLSPFMEGSAALKRDFDDMGAMVFPSGEERGELEIIRAASDRITAISGRMIGFMQAGRPDSARAIVRGGEANRAMERIEALVREMEQRETLRADDRRSAAESDFHESLIFLVLGSGLNFVLIIGLFMFMNR